MRALRRLNEVNWLSGSWMAAAAAAVLQYVLSKSGK